MKKILSSPAGPLKSKAPEAGKAIAKPSVKPVGASFDTASSFSEMKRLQDPAKFEKARFSFRLYRK